MRPLSHMRDSAGPPAWGPTDRQALHQALLAAFPSAARLRLMLRYGLGAEWETYLSDGSLTQQVGELIQAAAARDQLDALLEAAARHNPTQRALRRLATQHQVVVFPPAAVPPARPSLSS